MSDNTTILSLPMILPSQAQKHVTHNEALLILDVVVQLAVSDRHLSAPPGAPVDGNRYIVAAGASGAWAGQAGKIAAYTVNYWDFITPKAGWRAWIADEGQIATFDGTLWKTPSEGPFTATQLGVSATPDATNRLSVSSPGVLLNHAGAGVLAKINKAAATDSATLAFQTGFSGRAEIGTSGSDDLTIKVSPNGSAFSDAMTVARASGIVSLPQGVSASAFSLRDATDPTKRAEFVVSSLPTATTRSYTLPTVSGQFALLEGTQTFTGAKTFSGGFTVSAAAGTLGNATGTATYGVGAGATLSGSTKTVNLGTDGVSGSTTVVNVGSALAGAGGALVVNSPTVNFASSVTGVTMPNAALSANLVGVGGATADATNRLSVNTPAVLLNNAGAGIDMTFNKNAVANDATLSFKTGFSTRAIAGLAGSDAFTLKVSPNGSLFFDALTVAQATGRVTIANGAVLNPAAGDLASPVDGALWYNSTTGKFRAREAGVTVDLRGGGSGDVAGPAAAADNAIARFDATSGKLIQSSGALLSDLGELTLPVVTAPTIPPTNTVSIFSRRIAGRMLPAFIGPSGLDSALQPLMARNKVGYWNPQGNGVTVPGVFGFVAPTVTGFTATARNVATTNFFTRFRRMGYVTVATAGTVGQWRVSVSQYSLGDGAGAGGFTYIIRFGISDPATVADARMFIGMAVGSTTPSNIEPSTLVNCVGVGHGTADSNLRVFYGGSAAQTPIDLGASFPITPGSVEMYELALFAAPNSTGIAYEVTRLANGTVAAGTISGTPGTQLPAATTLLAPWGYRTNNASALVVGLDVASAYIETDY